MSTLVRAQNQQRKKHTRRRTLSTQGKRSESLTMAKGLDPSDKRKDSQKSTTHTHHQTDSFGTSFFRAIASARQGTDAADFRTWPRRRTHINTKRVASLPNVFSISATCVFSTSLCRVLCFRFFRLGQLIVFSFSSHLSNHPCMLQSGSFNRPR